MFLGVGAIFANVGDVIIYPDLVVARTLTFHLQYKHSGTFANRKVITKIYRIPGSSYIYNREGPVALYLGLINLRGQCVSGHVVRASFVSDTPPKCLDREGLGRRRTGARHGNFWTCYKSTSHKYLKEDPQ